VARQASEETLAIRKAVETLGKDTENSALNDWCKVHFPGLEITPQKIANVKQSPWFKGLSGQSSAARTATAPTAPQNGSGTLPAGQAAPTVAPPVGAVLKAVGQLCHMARALGGWDALQECFNHARGLSVEGGFWTDKPKL